MRNPPNPSGELLTHDEILMRFLRTKTRRFVQRVEREWLGYMQYPLSQGRPGCLLRERRAGQITKIVYNRYAETLTT